MNFDKKIIGIPFGELATASYLKTIAHIIEEQGQSSNQPSHPLLSGAEGNSPNLVMVNFKNTVQSLTSGASYALPPQVSQPSNDALSQKYGKAVKVYDYSASSPSNPFNFLSHYEVGQ